MKSLVLGSLIAAPLISFAAAEPVFQSGPAQIALVELYTSEGCSSCPPAEKWLAGLREDTGLWTSFVPVAFHVNYWDHLGWKDRLASPAFTQREHVYAAAWNSASVYTPCFVRNGTEWRPMGNRNADLSKARHSPDAGQLKVTWTSGDTARIEFTPNKETKAPLEVSVALLGSGIVSNVRAGENRGRELKHEFVALRLETVALQRSESGPLSATLKLPPRADLPASRHALAAWVTQRGHPTPLQATGGWID